ncbi:MAG: hypothetical protein JSW00_02710 [Thermoplasmata archaeon]|nr:MAG: hypothetical protein JSW00_02710 [Thermoplasmata archaeon]
MQQYSTSPYQGVQIPQQPMYTPPMMASGRPKISPKRATSLFFIIVVLVLLIHTLFFSWYYFEIEMDMEGESYGTPFTINGDAEIAMHLRESEIKTSVIGQTDDVTDESKDYDTDDYEDNDEIKHVMDVTFFLVIIAIIMGIISAIFVTLSLFGAISKIGGVISLIILLILSLIIPLYFAIALPAAIEENWDESNITESYEEIGMEDLKYEPTLYGSDKAKIDTEIYGTTMEGNYEWSWHPDIGWYISLISFISVLIAFSLMAASKQENLAIAPAVQPQYPQQPLPPQQPPPIQPTLQQSPPQRPPLQKPLPPPPPKKGIKPPPTPSKPPTTQPEETTFSCPHCRKPFTVPTPKQNVVINCPLCGGQTSIGP